MELYRHHAKHYGNAVEYYRTVVEFYESLVEHSKEGKILRKTFTKE
jgi:hypothetical protein